MLANNCRAELSFACCRSKLGKVGQRDGAAGILHHVIVLNVFKLIPVVEGMGAEEADDMGTRRRELVHSRFATFDEAQAIVDFLWSGLLLHRHVIGNLNPIAFSVLSKFVEIAAIV